MRAAVATAVGRVAQRAPLVAEQEAGARDVAAGEPWRPRRARGPAGDLVDEQLLDGVRVRIARNDLAAARADRLQQRLWLGADQDQMRERRRLLERLQQRVLALLGHRVGGLDHEHAAVGLERPVGDLGDHPLADVLDQVLGPARAQPDEVGMR